MSDKDAREEARKIVEAVETRWAARTQAPSEREAYKNMMTAFNCLLLAVEPDIVNDLLKTFKAYVSVAGT